MKPISITLDQIYQYEEKQYNNKVAGSMGRHVVKQDESIALKLKKTIDKNDKFPFSVYNTTPIPLSMVNELMGYDYALLCATILTEHNYTWRNLAVWYGEALIESGLITDQAGINVIIATKQYNNSVITEDELGVILVLALNKVKESFLRKDTMDITKYFIIPTMIAALQPSACLLDRIFINDPITLPKFLEVVG